MHSTFCQLQKWLAGNMCIILLHCLLKQALTNLLLLFLLPFALLLHTLSLQASFLQYPFHPFWLTIQTPAGQQLRRIPIAVGGFENY